MRPDDVVGLVIVLVIFAVVLCVYIGLIVLGVRIAQRKPFAALDVVCDSPDGATHHADCDGVFTAAQGLSELHSEVSEHRAALRLLRL